MSLKEIATTLNLSVMAVSKALRDAPDISTATRARVQAEATRRHYVPNRAAQNLRSRKSGLIGIVVPEIRDHEAAQYVWGVERQAQAQDSQVLLGHSLGRADDELQAVRKLIARQAEAVLLVPAVRWQNRLATLELLRAAQVPAVLLESYPAGADRFPQVSWVVSDDERGGLLATEHLLELGHRDILFLAGPNGSSSGAARFIGYQRALDQAGVAFSDQRVYLAGREIDSGRQAMTQALSEKTPFTAVVTHSDHVAFGAMQTLLQQGFRVPEDVSMVGFGDGLMAENFRVPLTTIRVPFVEMGAAALRLALELKGSQPVVPRVLPVGIMVRGSTLRHRGSA